jgi:signal transduction histidine kinase
VRRRVENTAEGSPRLPPVLPPPTRAAPRSSQDAALAVERPARERSTQVLLAAYWLVLAACTLLSLGRLLVGSLAFVLARSAALRDALSTRSPNPWVRAILDAAAHQEPYRQALVDYGFSLACLSLGVAILVTRRGTWSMRLVGLALLAASGTGNLSVQAAATAVRDIVSIPDAVTGNVFLQSVALAAFLLALVTYPVLRRGQGGPAPSEVLTIDLTTVVLSGIAATLLPAAVSYIVLFGLVLPLAGLALLRRRALDELTADERTRLRLLFSVFVGAATVAATLVVVTVATWSIGWDGLTLSDPTAPASEPDLIRESALAFWFSRLMTVGIGVSVLTAARRKGLYVTEGKFSRGLAVAIVATLVGGLFVVLHTTVYQLAEDRPALAGLEGVPAIAVAAVPAALAFLPIYLRVERWVDQLLYGRRPAPYSVLAGIGSVTNASSVNAPDLSRVAEAVGRGLGARVCRVTVRRPGLADRTYAWDDDRADDADALLTVPILRGDEQTGSLTVDRATVAGLHVQRQHLLDDIGDSLGSVLEASRLGIELERQLRAVRAHAAEIAVSRRRLVAEMDAERRRIERDLHDGAQHHLVSLRLSLGLVEHQVATGRFDQAKVSLDRIAEQIDVTESILTRTATGVSSPLLAQHGLVDALKQELAAGQPAVLLTTSGVDHSRRFPPDIASAVWFCCLEAVNNARKYARGAVIDVRLRAVPGRLEFGVHDDGPGWDMSAGDGSPGRGMRNVIARVTVVGGNVSVHSEPGAGTRIDGWVPLPDQPTEASEGEAAAAGEQSADGVSSAEESASLITSADDTLVGKARDALREALTRYGNAPAAERVRQILESVDEVPDIEATDAGPPLQPSRRIGILSGWTALRELDALVRSEPPDTGAASLLHRLERINSGAHELAEVDAIDALRSGTYPLTSDDVEHAARLLGEFGEDPCARLGLPPGTDPSLITAAAEQAMAVWRARASHPATMQPVRMLAATVVRSCEHLLALNALPAVVPVDADSRFVRSHSTSSSGQVRP